MLLVQGCQFATGEPAQRALTGAAGDVLQIPSLELGRVRIRRGWRPGEGRRLRDDRALRHGLAGVHRWPSDTMPLRIARPT